jgi:hypothetical protein
MVQRMILDSARNELPAQATALTQEVSLIWTFLVAIVAARLLLELHPGLGGLRLIPSGEAAHPFCIKSEKHGLIWAETLAAIDPRGCQIVASSVARLAGRLECHRYGIFMSPLFPGTERRSEFEQSGVQVWSVDI